MSGTSWVGSGFGRHLGPIEAHKDPGPHFAPALRPPIPRTRTVDDGPHAHLIGRAKCPPDLRRGGRRKEKRLVACLHRQDALEGPVIGRPFPAPGVGLVEFLGPPVVSGIRKKLLTVRERTGERVWKAAVAGPPLRLNLCAAGVMTTMELGRSAPRLTTAVLPVKNPTLGPVTTVVKPAERQRSKASSSGVSRSAAMRHVYVPDDPSGPADGGDPPRPPAPEAHRHPRTSSP